MRAGASTDPSPIVPTASVSSTPNTRARTSSGTARCSSVRPATSVSESPIPSTASRTSAAASSGSRPMRISGTPHSTTPSAYPAASRLPPISAAAPSAPITPPTLIAALR